MEKVNEYKFELACCIALSAVGVNFWRELQVIGIYLKSNRKTRAISNGTYIQGCLANSYDGN